MTRPIDRRLFLSGSAATLGYFFTADAFSAVRAADKPNDKLRMAGIGIGGKGDGDISQAGKLGEVVAICDIDDTRLAKKAKEFPQAKQYFDFRKMLDEMAKDIDAVTVSTPDHTHAPAALRAMRMKKHAYVQKPLTHNVMEARLMRETAKKMGVCTQMGNQGTAGNGLRRAVEFIQSGGIGEVKQVHVWTNRPIWPQAPKITKRPEPSDAPATVHWDEFLGPAPLRPYAKGYHPFAWRGFWDFGTGALGDMACHTANMAFMALKLAYPTSVVAEAGDVNPETCPSWAHVTIEFPARDKMPAVTWNWYEGMKDGKNILPSVELVKGAGEREKGYSIYFKDGKWQFRNGNNSKPKVVSSGSFLVGERATLFSPDDYGGESYIVTADGVEKLTGDPEKLPLNGKGDQGQKDEWVQAIRDGKPELALSNFDYAGMLTETVLLGNVAIRAGKKLEWDGPNLRCPNCKEADEFIRGTYRKGWEVDLLS
jgi:predicted dehydrogenase